MVVLRSSEPNTTTTSSARATEPDVARARAAPASATEDTNVDDTPLESPRRRGHIRYETPVDDDDDDDDGPNIRARYTQPAELLDPSLHLDEFHNETFAVSLRELAQDESELELDLGYLDAQLIRVIVALKQHNAIYSYQRGRNTQGSNVQFNRLFLFRPISNEEGNQLFYMMQSSSVNSMLWGQNYQNRDNGVISCGSFIRLLAPDPISRYMAGEVPMLTVDQPAVVLAPPSAGFDPIPINYAIEAGNLRSFVLTPVTLSLRKIAPKATTCSGLFCDKQRLSDWVGTPRGCGCYTMVTRRSNLSFDHSIVLALPDGSNIKMTNFSSTAFSKLYLDTYVPSSVNVSTVRGNSNFLRIRAAAKAILALINENGGFTAIGWYKRGQINDKGLVGSTENSTNQRNSDDARVESGELNFHIVSIEPANRDFLRSTSALFRQLKGMKYEVASLNQL